MNEHSSIAATPSGTSALDRLFRRALLLRLRGMGGGRMTIDDALGRVVVGTPDGPHVKLRVNDMGFYRLAGLSGSVGAAEAYADGTWDCPDLVGLVQLLVRNRDLLDSMEGGLARASGWALRAWHALRPNHRAGARRNVAEHYDLGNEFFELFLSADLMYSSALFESDDDTLEAASQRKLERICEKLQLQAGDRVLEIGTGWGGFALHAARHQGCHVTTTTISRRQHELAVQRVAAAGLSDRVTVLLDDFRDLQGTFDKVVSNEMVEAIGARNLPRFFQCIDQCLAPDGLALVQAITIEDHRYEQALRSVDFIKRHIFPGSFIPSISAMLAAKASASALALIHLGDFGQSYAATLAQWRQRFHANAGRVRSLGFDERFIRMWDFYLAYCEGGFRERSIGVAHLLLAKPGYRGASFKGATPTER